MNEPLGFERPLKGAALVIGVDAYTGSVKPLQSAVTDARAIAEILRDQHAYDVRLLLDSQADAASIFRALESDYPKRLEENDAFLLYFAGHGVARGDGSEGPQGYLLPYDATLGDQDSWMAMDRLRTALEALPCKHLLVILDCCFAGSFRWASTRDVLIEGRPLYDSQYERYLRGTAWQALTSASHNQVAVDVSPGYSNTRDGEAAGRHSPFALALIEGLAGSADSSRGGYEPDGVITATELFQYAFEKFSGGDPLRQTPGIWPLRPDNTGEFIFLNPKLPRKTLPDPPLDEANNPWMGLSSYTSEQSQLLYGREKCVAEILERIVARKRPRLVAVIGASGTGKSSVVKAGVLPRLENPPKKLAARIGKWNVCHVPRLGDDPVGVLRQAFREPGAPGRDVETLLFIDQFEELYTQCHDRARRDAFLDELRKLVDENVTVVLTLRSDFEPQPEHSAALADVWAEARIVVPSFSGEEFRECIEGPAAVKALYFDPKALVGELVDEVMAMPGALPMLSFTLAEMYRCAQIRRRRDGSNDRALTQDDYRATGGVVGALHRRASALFDESTPDVQATIQRVFLRMIAQDGARLTRRRISLTELAYPEPDEQARIGRVQKEFVDARLLVIDADTIEPAHDTLVVAWDKLLEWLSAAGPQNLIRAVWHAALAWQTGGAIAGMSWHDDPRLPLALSKREQLNTLEQRFIDASETNRKRRINRAISIAAAVGILILGSAVVAWQQRNHAMAQEEIALEQEARAEQQRDRALASSLLANAQAQTDPVIKGLTVSEIFARGLPQPSRAAELTRRALEQMTVVDGHIFRNGTGWDIRRLTTSGHITFQTLLGDQVNDSWSFEPVLFRNQARHGRVIANEFTANQRSAYATYEGDVTVYWPNPLESELAISIREPVAGLAADASGTVVAIAAGNEARILEIDPRSGEVSTRLLDRHSADFSSIALTADARWAAAGSTDGQLRLWNLATGELAKRESLADGVAGIALGEGGEYLAAATINGTIRLWRSNGDSVTEQVGRCTGEPQMLTLSPRNQVLAGTCGGQAWIWNTGDLSAAKSYSSEALRKVKFVVWPDSFYPGGPWPTAFGHDGLWLIGLGVPHPPIAWPVITAAIPPAVMPGQFEDPALAQNVSVPSNTETLVQGDEFTAAELTGTGHLLGFRVTESAEGHFDVDFILRDLETMADASESHPLPWGQQPDEFRLVLDPAGRKVLALATDGNFWSAVLFDTAATSNDLVTVGRLDGALLRSALFSPDGDRLLVLADRMNPNIIHADPRLYDTSDLSEVRVLGGQRFVAHGVFTDDGTRLVTTDCYGESRLWNADGSGDPVVFNAGIDDSLYLCGVSEGAYSATSLPSAWFSPDGDYLFTQMKQELPATQIVGFGPLSQQIRSRSFACLTSVQREQFLAETPERARAEYDSCMTALAIGAASE